MVDPVRRYDRRWLERWFPVAADRRPVPGQRSSDVLGNLSGYGLAVLAVAAAVLTTSSVPPLRVQPPTLLFFAAVVLTSWYAGMRAGFLASVLSMLMLDLFFVKKVFSLRFEILEDGLDFVAFATVSWLVSTFQTRWRRTHRKLVAVEQEMQIARRIQQQFFPISAPEVSGFEIAGGCFPATDMGGDFYDFIPLSHNRLGIAIGDVSGHGIGPAIAMALLRAYLRALALTYVEPEEILGRANRLVCDDTKHTWFATVFLLQLDPQSRQFCYAGAGHECYLLDPSGDMTRLESTGIPLGISTSATIQRSAVRTLQPGQLVLLLSDGIVESRSRAGELFGLERLLDAVRPHQQHSAQTIVAAAFEAVAAYRGDVAQQDDVTLVVIKAKSSAPADLG